MLRTVWKTRDENEARSLLNNVIEVCKAIADEHGFKAIRKFANMLTRRADGIVTAGQVGYGTNILEGANNTAKVIKRVGYGFQDFEYFSLKLKSAFPGKRFKGHQSRLEALLERLSRNPEGSQQNMKRQKLSH